MSGHNEKCCLLAVTGRWMQHHVSFMKTCSLAKSQMKKTFDIKEIHRAQGEIHCSGNCAFCGGGVCSGWAMGGGG